MPIFSKLMLTAHIVLAPIFISLVIAGIVCLQISELNLVVLIIASVIGLSWGIHNLKVIKSGIGLKKYKILLKKLNI